MEKTYGLNSVELEKILDMHVMNNGGMFAAREMRKGLEEMINENNKALIASVKELIKESQKQ